LKPPNDVAPESHDPQAGHVLHPGHPAADEWIGAKQFEVTDIAGGCLMISVSAVVSCGLLVINGGLVMAILSAIAAGGVNWVQNEKFSQFVLFAAPIGLLILQWMLLDTLRWIIRRRKKAKI